MGQVILFQILLLFAFAGLLYVLILMNSRWVGYVSLTLLFSAGSALLCTSAGRYGILLFVAFLVFGSISVIFLRPDLKVSFEGTLAREIIRLLVRKSGRDMLYDLPKSKPPKKPWKAPKGYTLTVKNVGGIPIEQLTYEAGCDDKVILQLHGGGYIGGLENSHRENAVMYSKVSGGALVVTPDYRKAPEHVYPSALDDALTVWDWLLTEGHSPKNIIVTGDSAGGNLALSLLLKLRDADREFPAALFCMSPWTDLAAEGESYSFNQFRDPLFGKSPDYLPTASPVPTRKPWYAGDASLHDPYLSPVCGSFESFPPMLLQTGTWEILLSDSVTVHEKALSQGVDSTLSLYPGMFHAFQFARGFLKESRAAWAEAGKFLREHFNENG
jgi:epsilon-lactone hydrolase